jgi:hypothetical protein
MVYAVDLLDFCRLRCGASDEAGARSHVLKCNGVVFWMKICFHNSFRLLPPRFRRGGTGKLHDFEDLSSRYPSPATYFLKKIAFEVTTDFKLAHKL